MRIHGGYSAEDVRAATPCAGSGQGVEGVGGEWRHSAHWRGLTTMAVLGAITVIGMLCV